MFIEKLITRYGSDKKITSLLENKTVYVAPLLNPDAAESFFIEPRFERSTNYHPMDDDGDGLTDEDSPDDLNNDGKYNEDPLGTEVDEDIVKTLLYLTPTLSVDEEDRSFLIKLFKKNINKNGEKPD